MANKSPAAQLLHRREQKSHGAGSDPASSAPSREGTSAASQEFSPKHRMGFAGARLTVGQAARRTAIHYTIDERQCAFRKDLGLRRRLAEDAPEAEAALPLRTVRVDVNGHYIVGGLDDARRFVMELALARGPQARVDVY